MEKGVDINIDDFMSLFIAISFLQEQRILNIINIKNYLSYALELDDKTLKGIDSSIDKMIEAKMISKVTGFDNIIKISKRIPFKEIVYDKYDYLEDMIELFYEYNNYCFGLENNKEMSVLKK